MNSRAVQFLFPRYIKNSLSLRHIAPLLSFSVSGLSMYQIPLCHWQFEMNDHIYLSISKPVPLYNLTVPLIYLTNCLSFKLITAGNSCDLLEAQSCCYKSNHMKTFDRILFRRSELQTTVVLSSLRDRSLVISLCMVLMDDVCRWKWAVADKYSVPGAALAQYWHMGMACNPFVQHVTAH